MAADPRVSILRDVLRHLQVWRAIHEAEGMETITFPGGEQWSLWDVHVVLEKGLPLLPPRQRQAIQLCLLEGLREVDVARIMGVSLTNPVSMYAAEGLKSLVRMMDEGTIPALTDQKRESV